MTSQVNSISISSTVHPPRKTTPTLNQTNNTVSVSPPKIRPEFSPDNFLRSN